MTAPSSPTATQPILVRIAVVLVYLSGLTSVAIGILILLSRYQVDKAEVLPVSLLGSGVILFGLLTIAVGSGIARGRPGARLLLTLYLAAQFVLHIITIISTDSWDWAAIIELVLYAFIALAVWAPPGSRYFRPTPADQTAAASARAT